MYTPNNFPGENQQRTTILVLKYLQDSLNSAEREEFAALMTDSEKAELLHTLENDDTLQDKLQEYRRFQEVLLPDTREKLQRKINAPKEKTSNILWKGQWWRTVAAVFALVATCATLFLLTKEKSPHPANNGYIGKEKLPAQKGATLILSDGKRFLIDEKNDTLTAVSGTVRWQGGTARAGSSKEYAVLKTEYGQRTTIRLTDGTVVVLNAGSQLRFPMAFEGNLRQVELSGEAYFAVAHNPSMPFQVQTPDGVQVDVLGTEFIVSAYPEEPTLGTTLVSGTVKIFGKFSPVKLQPGEKITVLKGGLQTTQVTSVNTADEMGWLNNKFQFNTTEISEVLQELKRWYNVEIRMEKGVSERYTASIPRNLPLSRVLEILDRVSEATTFNFEENAITAKHK